MHLLSRFEIVADRILAKYRQVKSLWHKHKADQPDNDIYRPPTVQYLLANRDTWKISSDGDTSLSSLYRMYECFVLDNITELRNEIEYFFNTWQWPVASIPDPKDPSPARYAVLAVLLRFVVRAFHYKISFGIPRDAPGVVGTDKEWDELRSRPKKYEQLPKWAKKARPLKRRLVIPKLDGSVPPTEKDACKKLLDMNIYAWSFTYLFM
ncbi:MAG: hypothetical protein M1821_003099 [Bathelium mastoideum]|nr:MAG: hypothetical protein M1821_003099 [Bathelium mastoideum]